MRVMLDNGIQGHSQFGKCVSVSRQIEWGGKVDTIQVTGFVRKRPHIDPAYQAEINALFTIGRLIREQRIQAFTYCELMFEAWRRVIGEQAFDALADCPIKYCEPALERSRFFKGDGSDYVRKGGKKDRQSGEDTSMSQVRFVEWIISLTNESTLQLISIRDVLKISDFEVESLLNLPWFRTMCRIAQSSENYPDMLHLWTAQRNRMHVFLTLENRLPNIATHFPTGQSCGPSFATQVLRPLELLSLLEIPVCDEVPIEAKYFYPIVGSSFQIDDADV